MKRYDTHRNFPPARRPRDSTPAPPDDDELEKLLGVSSSAPSDTLLASPERDVTIEPKHEPEPTEALPSSVESAVTAYVESLPASDPEPRIEEREIDVDAEAERRKASAVDVVSAETAVADAKQFEARAPSVEKELAARATPARREADDDDDEDEEDEDEDPNSVAPASSRRSEAAPVDSVAATARSTAPSAVAKRGTSPVMWIAAFALGGMGLAMWAMREPVEVREKAAVHAATPAVEIAAPLRAEPVATASVETAALAPPATSASAATPAASAR
jgi:hypothetical protein